MQSRLCKHAKLKALKEFDAGQIPPNTNVKYFTKKCSVTLDRYRRIAKNSTSSLVAPPKIFRLLIKGKFDAYLLCPFGPQFKSFFGIGAAISEHIIVSSCVHTLNPKSVLIP